MTGDERRAYSPERLDQAIAQITEIAELEGVEVALCGGLAMQSYGSDRLTKDVDFVASDTLKAIQGQHELSFGGSEFLAPNGVPVDFIVRADVLEAMYEVALGSAISRPGIPCKVVRPEYLAAMKLAAGRARDILDLHYLIVSKTIDYDDTRSLIKRYVGGWYAARDFDMQMEDAFLEAKRDHKIRG